MKEGCVWQINKDNVQVIKLYFDSLEKFFSLNNKTSIYLGVRVGRVGEVWDLVNKVSIDEFRTR